MSPERTPGSGVSCGAGARRRLPLSPTVHSEPCKPSQHQSAAVMSPSEAGPRPPKYEYPDCCWGISMPGASPLRCQCRCLPRYTSDSPGVRSSRRGTSPRQILDGDASAGQRSQSREGRGLRDRQMRQGRRALAPALYTPRSWMANHSSKAAALAVDHVPSDECSGRQILQWLFGTGAGRSVVVPPRRTCIPFANAARAPLGTIRSFHTANTL